MHGTEVERIPGNFFKSTPDMAFVGFQNNKIKYVGAELLENLPKLQKVNFQENVCINDFSMNAKELKRLINDLKTKCQDEEKPTTENPEDGTTENPLIDNSARFDEEILNLQQDNLNLKQNLDKLGEKFNDIKEILSEIFITFNAKLIDVENRLKNCTNN